MPPGILDNRPMGPTLPGVSKSVNLDAFEAVLLDLDGTIYHEEHALAGAVQLVARLRAGGRKFAFLTNSTASPIGVAARLKRMGMDVAPATIYTAAAAAADYVTSGLPAFRAQTHADLDRSRLPRVFNLSTEGVAEMLQGKVHWVAASDESCDAVIVGVPLNVFATEDRQRLAMLLLRKGATLVAICADRVYPSPRGLEFGVGAMTAMLAYAADVRPVFCGKPEARFFRELCHRVGAPPERCVLIGDNLESDIAGAKGVGMKTILTLTGVATRADALKLPLAFQPDWIIDDLTSL